MRPCIIIISILQIFAWYISRFHTVLISSTRFEILMAQLLHEATQYPAPIHLIICNSFNGEFTSLCYKLFFFNTNPTIEEQSFSYITRLIYAQVNTIYQCNYDQVWFKLDSIVRQTVLSIFLSFKAFAL